MLELYTANKKPVFDFRLDDFYVLNGKTEDKCCFFTTQKRLVEEEKDRYMLFFENISQNFLVLYRFSYQDLYGNKYVQDIPVTIAQYTDTQQSAEIRDIKAPVLVADALTLKETVKCYSDYEAFVSAEENIR